jgi:hypothetical protein
MEINDEKANLDRRSSGMLSDWHNRTRTTKQIARRS